MEQSQLPQLCTAWECNDRLDIGWYIIYGLEQLFRLVSVAKRQTWADQGLGTRIQKMPLPPYVIAIRVVC